jgi:Predicted membrane protein (DUF2207)
MRTTLQSAAALAAVLVAALTIGAAPAAAKTYSAERFDSHVRVLPGGDLEVTETVVFRFESGTFDHVFREIPARRTDGIEVVSASLDGRTLPFGDSVNEVEVSGKSKVRVEWRFHPLSSSTHVFVLVYIARGVVSQTETSDVLAWRALPGEHEYRIASSTVEVVLPGSAAAGTAAAPEPKTEWHRIEGAVEAIVRRGNQDAAAPSVIARATAQEIRSNGWIEVTFDLPRGSLLTTPPAWQQARQSARALAPRWMTAAAILAFAGLIVLFGIRQNYDAPPGDQSPLASSSALPDALAPGLVGALVANGSPSPEHAMATLFSLADRGLISIDELAPGVFGQHKFEVRRRHKSAMLAGHEVALLGPGLDDSRAPGVSLDSFRHQWGERFQQFSTAVHQDLAAAGLIDADRKRIRTRYFHVAIVTLILAGVGALTAAVALVDRFGAWPMLLPAALALVGIAALIFAASTTPLSNEGVRRAARWRGFRGYMKALTQDPDRLAVQGLPTLLPFAVAIGLASAWAKYLKHHPGSVPSWFSAHSTASPDSAFASFLTASGAHDGGAGAAGGGAAGGGSSGAG